MKGGDRVLQYPTNVSIDNQTIDYSVAGVPFEWTFNGDILSTIIFIMKDYNTGEQIGNYDGYSWYQEEDYFMPLAYNGDTVTSRVYPVSAGNDYTVQMLLVQFDPEGENYIADMPVARGVVSEPYNEQAYNRNELFIEPYLECIYEFKSSVASNVRTYVPLYYTNGYQITYAIVRIGNETRVITSYETAEYNEKDTETRRAIAHLNEKFSTFPPAGTPYQIYVNYIYAPEYFFKCRSTPEITMGVENITEYPMSLEFTAEYSQAENTLISSYYTDLYCGNSYGSYPIHVGTTYEKYSQNIEAQYWYPYLAYGLSGNWIGYTYYKFVIHLTTNDGCKVNYEKAFQIPSLLNEVSVNNVSVRMWDKKFTIPNSEYKQEVTLSCDYEGADSGDCLLFFRKNINTNEVVPIVPVNWHGSSVVDVAVPNKGEFEYVIQLVDVDGLPYQNGRATVEVKTNMSGYSITALKPIDEGTRTDTGIKEYLANGSWLFVGDISDTTITLNRDIAVHLGYNQYPSTSNTAVKYMSGTFSGMLGYVECLSEYGDNPNRQSQYVDDIEVVKAWREFITQDCEYLLKSEKGDVWIVRIIESPTIDYQENHHTVPARVNFTWVETRSVKDTIIRANAVG